MNGIIDQSEKGDHGAPNIPTEPHRAIPRAWAAALLVMGILFNGAISSALQYSRLHYEAADDLWHGMSQQFFDGLAVVQGNVPWELGSALHFFLLLIVENVTTVLFLYLITILVMWVFRRKKFRLSLLSITVISVCVMTMLLLSHYNRLKEYKGNINGSRETTSTIVLTSLSSLDWKMYYLTEGDFSIYMPQKPSMKVSKQKVSKELIQTYSYQSCINNCVIAYSASFADFGRDSHIAKDPNTALEFAKAGVLKNANGKLTYESYIDYKGFPGKELKINIETDHGLYVGIQRFYIINGKVYELNVSTPVKSQFMPEHYRFLDSFKIGK